MPYIKKGTTIYKKTNGLKKVGKSSPSKVKSYLRTLRAVERGWKPTRQKRGKK